MSAIRHALTADALPLTSEPAASASASSSASTSAASWSSADAPSASLASSSQTPPPQALSSPALSSPSPRERLEALLRAKKLDGTLASTDPLTPADAAARAARLAPTGWPEVDRRLGGGFPRGECSEIVGARSTGRTSVLCALLAAAAARGDIVALVDACDRFDPVSAAGLGLALDRLLWVRGFSPEPPPATAGMRTAAAPSTPAGLRLGPGRRASMAELRAREEAARQERRLERAIKAFGLILQAGGFGIVALDLADEPLPALRRLPFTTWRRLQRLLERTETVGLLLAAEPIGRSARGVTLRLSPGEGGAHLAWTGESHRARLFTGFALHLQVHSARRLDEADDASAAASERGSERADTSRARVLTGTRG